MISAVILNYLNAELTCRCIDKLVRASKDSGIDVEIIVVDNSASQTAEVLHQSLPEQVVLIENDENTGFSKANNLGVTQAHGDYILIMNNDLFLNSEVLKKGLEYIASRSYVGIWAPMLTDQQGHPQRSCAHFPTLTGLMSEYFMNICLDNRVARKALQAAKPVQVDTVIGACMLIPATVYKDAGGFDEDYFFNSEDVDLCRAVKNHGYKIVFDPRCSAIHLISASQKHTRRYQDEYLHQSRILYFKKNHHALKAMAAEYIIRIGVEARKFKHHFLER